MGLNEIIHIEAHCWCMLCTQCILIIVTKMFPHYYDLDFIYIKAALQMSSKDTLTSLYTNSMHTKRNTNNYFFSIGLIYITAGPRKVALTSEFKASGLSEALCMSVCRASSQPQHSKVMAPTLQTIVVFFLH